MALHQCPQFAESPCRESKMSLTLLLLIGPAHVAHVAMRRPVVLRSVAVAMTEPVGTAEGAPVSPAPAVSEPAPKAAEAPKAAAAPAPQAMRPMPAQAVSRVPSKPTVPFGNGKRPRAEWDKPANYGRYSQMKQAYFSTLLPKTLRVPFVDFEIPVPTFKRPPLLDGTHAGDMGFDPLGLAKDVPTLQTYLEAELKHGRLAMLAVAGWVAAELLAESGLAPGGRAPSLLNGGLFRLQNFLCTGLIFALFSMLEEGREPKSSASMYKDGPGLYDWQHFLDGPCAPRRAARAPAGRAPRLFARAIGGPFALHRALCPTRLPCSESSRSAAATDASFSSAQRLAAAAPSGPPAPGRARTHRPPHARIVRARSPFPRAPRSRDTATPSATCPAATTLTRSACTA